MRCVSIGLQNCADGAFLNRDDRVIPREARRDFAYHPVTHRVMVATGNQRGARRRAERRGVKIGVAQSLCSDTIHRRGRNHPTKRGRRAIADVVRHNKQHVGRAFWRHDTWGPPGLRIRSFLPNHPAECRIGRRNLFSVDGGGGAGRTRDTGDLLGQCGYATKGEKTGTRKDAAADLHGG